MNIINRPIFKNIGLLNKIGKEPIKTRVLWYPTLLQDLRSYHNIDAEVALAQYLTNYIGEEINREIITQISPSIYTINGIE